MAGKYGQLVRLWGVNATQLPAASATTAEVAQVVSSIFQEALPFIKDVPSAKSSPEESSWKAKGTKTFAHSTAPVYLYERIVSAEDLRVVNKEHNLPQVNATKLQPEAWFLRRTDHEDAAKTGTATWDEFLKSFKDNHAEAEQAFTPTVLSTSLDQQWSCAGLELEIDGETWVDWTLKLEKSVHKLPAPLNNRTFPVLQATASVRGRREFVVVQLAAGNAIAKPTSDDGTVLGAYTSIERLRDTGDGKIEWIMGTASDAKGVLPAWMQKMAVPGAVAKDVDMFLQWIDEQRKKTAAVAE